ncbi:MAG TPA: SpoIVB peptidase S55 domain-containing protein [Candidatus Acidoferrales bacterium]|nr:SpoIVB peptidase S55 domain-containing protein [Candidatus Acidoferrales bacterium]
MPLLAMVLLAGFWPFHATDNPAILPVSEIQPGMKGVAYTIFEGDKVEKIDLEVIGVLHNAVGPKLDVILVRLLGDKVQQTGVVAGMSGSPVYIDGKLVGALALKLGTFTREAIGGVTPIADMLEIEQGSAASAPAIASASSRVPVPEEFAQRTAAGGGQFLVPIETPLIAAGLYPETLARFGKDFSAWGMTAMAGGTAAPSPDDAKLQPGDMVGIDLVRGDLSISSGCTVTTVVGNRILACGHPIFGFGTVAMPLSRAHVLMTLASAASSTKIISTGGTIGTLTQDRQTAVMGTLGAGPPMIPVDVTLDTPAEKKQYHFEVIESAQLTPTLVAAAAYNGIVGSPAYGEGFTLQMDGAIQLKGHTPVKLEDLFAPTDQQTPAAFFVATEVMTDFARIYANPYELPQIERIDLTIKSLAERRGATIDNAWIERSSVRPGETVAVKVLLRPYRGAPFIQEIPVTIPAQTGRGTLQLMISDAAYLNRNVQSLAATSQGQLPGLEELIQLINRERHNDRLYAVLLQSTPTMLVEDKEMPNVPMSAISVLDQRQNPGNARLLLQSTAGEWSVEMHQVIAGQHMLTITVK